MEQVKKQQQLYQYPQQQPSKSGWKYNPKNPAKSLLDIQAEEQERQMSEEATKSQNRPSDSGSFGSQWTGNAKEIISKLPLVPPIINNIAAPSVPNDASSVWEPLSTAPFHHHQGNSRKPQKPIDNSQFPALAPTKSSTKQQQQSKKPAADAVVGGSKANTKTSKEEVVVQKLFEMPQVRKDELTEWCQQSLKGMKVDVDIPTLVGLLRDIESTEEVYDYVYSYLGESKRIKEFAQQFIEKRKKGNAVATAAAAAGGPKQQQKSSSSANATSAAVSSSTSAASAATAVASSRKGKKQKMTKLDGTMLGFSVLADPSRVNVGEIDSVPLVHKK
ncbi:hypothetical protein HELRODRAFT_110285 [Helobdella robusta]|uniref:Uncharacterized protein n=1 Tax=Helobdella robusta TaxID=6412 RepID=T1EF11_HELRO|nr:hypothetical protein HELRODRAFT_110285 [Helobdella robusta]ESO08043.1 hypothetical protein HELRODRAFT_110285 [Helobdella robusta]